MAHDLAAHGALERPRSRQGRALQEIAVALQVPSVVAGTVDATLSLEPVGSIAIASKEAKRAMTNPVAMFIADPFYSGVSVLTTKFIKERPAVARKVVDVARPGDATWR